MKNLSKILLCLLVSLNSYADFFGDYPTTGVPTYMTSLFFPSPVTSGNGALAIALDTDILYISTGSAWEILADPSATSSAITGLTGDVSASGPGIVAATVNSVGGSSASSVNLTVVEVAAAASANTPSTLVIRDASGNFSAGTITAALTGTASGNPPNARAINTTAPLTGGGNLSADRTIAIPVATTSVNGYLSSTDWNTFNGKQASGSYITSLTGGVTASGPGAAAATVVTNANLTGPITSSGNATAIASQTGTGTKFVVDTSPTLITPILGVASGTSLSLSGQFTSTATTGTAPFVIASTTLVPNLYVARSALADTVTTNANLTGPITSSGNATSIASQTGTGTTFVMQASPTLTTPTLTGFTDASSAAAGKVGEVLTASLVRTSRATLTSNTSVTLCSLTLTAGDWDIRAWGSFSPSSGALVTQYVAAIANIANTAINVLPVVGTRGIPNAQGELTSMITTAGAVTNDDFVVNIGESATTTSGTTTIYLTVQATFTTAAFSAYGSILARRRR